MLKRMNKINYKKLYEQQLTENKKLKEKIKELNKEFKLLKSEFEKGKLCSFSGNNYEKNIYKILKQCKLNNKIFNTQEESELGGSNIRHDIQCNFINDKDIGIEIKKYNTPDWMQCCVKYNKELKKFVPSQKSKIPKECRNIFERLINNVNLYDGKIPPFIEKHLTYDEWTKIKNDTNDWDDIYIDIPNNIIRKLYSIKGCEYIQLSNGYGLYHLGDDICNFNVPIFTLEQQIRIRIKVHTRKNKNGFYELSITLACQPKNISSLKKSNYSLDNIDKLPINLTYIKSN